MPKNLADLIVKHVPYPDTIAEAIMSCACGANIGDDLERPVGLADPRFNRAWAEHLADVIDADARHAEQDESRSFRYSWHPPQPLGIRDLAALLPIVVGFGSGYVLYLEGFHVLGATLLALVAFVILAWVVTQAVPLAREHIRLNRAYRDYLRDADDHS